jgi:hypothetical protein
VGREDNENATGGFYASFFDGIEATYWLRCAFWVLL